MNRPARRAAEAGARRDARATAPEAVVHRLLVQMMDDGASINDSVRAAVGGAPNSGHVVDVLMNAAAAFETQVNAGALDEAFKAAVRVLFLARDLAIREGKIQVATVPSA